jgi:hypothetical protein
MDMRFGTWNVGSMYRAGSKMDLRESGLDVMDWIALARDRDQWRALVNTVMNLGVP